MVAVLWPNGSALRPRVSSPYGYRTHPVTGKPLTFHYGIDLGHDFDVIKAPVSGVVIFAGYNGGAGNEVRIREDGTGHVFRLFHNRALWVKTGQRVGQGQDVALMGMTGMSTGVHCHFQIEINGKTVEPTQYINDRNASAAGGGSSAFEPEPEPEKEKDIMKIISNSAGGQRFSDEFGSDDIGNYFFVPNGVDQTPTWSDNIYAAWLLAGKPEAAPDGWQYDLARHQANARWAQKRGEIVTDTVNALRPFLDALGQAVAGLSPEAIRTAIDEGLKGVVVEAEPLSEEETERLAALTAEVTRERFRTDPLA